MAAPGHQSIWIHIQLQVLKYSTYPDGGGSGYLWSFYLRQRPPPPPPSQPLFPEGPVEGANRSPGEIPPHTPGVQRLMSSPWLCTMVLRCHTHLSDPSHDLLLALLLQCIVNEDINVLLGKKKESKQREIAKKWQNGKEDRALRQSCLVAQAIPGLMAILLPQPPWYFLKQDLL